jgi:hypothetical protein
VLKILGGYIAIVWLMFCFWVFIDARKRYEHLLTAVIFALFIVPFNLPGLILYLVVRPDDEWPGLEDEVDSFAQVPIVRLMDDQEEILLKLQIELKRPKNGGEVTINATEITEESEKSIPSTDVASSNEQIEPVAETRLIKNKFQAGMMGLRNGVDRAGQRIGSSIRSLSKNSKPIELDSPTTIEIEQSSKKSKKKHKKHHRR